MQGPNRADLTATLTCDDASTVSATKSRVVEEIGKLALSTISDVLEIRDGQLVVRDHASLTEDQLAAV
jgi:hypothetical protein